MSSLSTHATYDEVPYEGGIATVSHPQYAAVIGRLFGMKPADVKQCRVLEIGCGVGQNLVPMAYSLPGSRFLGIDLSSTHIDQARRAAAAMELTNVSFEQVDIRDFTTDETFDYIICHGVYSWVPPDARAAILEVCRNHLEPQGIAHISYNVLPGWHMRGAVREMMRSHARFFPDHGERVEQARALVEFLAEATGHFDGASQLASAYHNMMTSELQMLRDRADYYVMHEHLAEDNQPLYFLDFAEHLAQHGLQYLGDANFASMLSENLPASVRETLDSVSKDHLALEQYRDFVLNRMFRQSLVVRGDVELDREISPDVVRGFTVRAALRLTEGQDWQVPRAGGTFSSVQNPFIIAVLEVLSAAHPGSLSFEGLFDRLNDGPWPEELPASDRRDHLATILLSLFATDGVELRAWDPEIAMALSERPAVFRPALFADNGKGTPSPHHVTYGFNSLVVWLLPLVRGLLPREKLVAAVRAQMEEGTLSVTGLPENTSIESIAEALVFESLEQLRTTGLLER